MKRICSECGAEFDGFSCDKRCPACRRPRIQPAKEYTCRRCGKKYDSRATRSFYCPDCRKAVNTEEARVRRKCPAPDGNRKLGSTDFCKRCGAAFVVRSGTQKYCDACHPAMNREKSHYYYHNYYGQNRDGGNETGFRWVRKELTGVFSASFMLGGKRYRKSGFPTAEAANIWAAEEREKILSEKEPKL